MCPYVKGRWSVLTHVTCPGAPDGQGAPKLCHLEGHAILALMKGKDTRIQEFHPASVKYISTLP